MKNREENMRDNTHTNLRKVICICIMGVVIFSLNAIAYAEETRLYGCARDGIMVEPGHGKGTLCPVCGLPVTEIKEIYVATKKGNVLDKRRAIVSVDTLPENDKKNIDIRENCFAYNVYTSSDGNQKFDPCQECIKELVKMKYSCNQGMIVSKNYLNKTCLFIMTRSAAQEEQAGQLILEPQDNPVESLAEIKEERMRQAIEGSWPIFREQHIKTGMSEEMIKNWYEGVKKQIYEQFGYDPATNTFNEAPIKEALEKDQESTAN